MSLKERLLKVQKEGAGLSQRVEQKKKLEMYKQQVNTVVVAKASPLLCTERLLVTAGVLDILAEAIDYTKGDVSCFITPALNDPIRESGRCDSISIALQWGDLDSRWQELWVNANTNTGRLDICAISNEFPVHSGGRYTFPYDPQILFNESLTREWWQDREKLESAMAEALWTTGIRIPNGEARYR